MNNRQLEQMLREIGRTAEYDDMPIVLQDAAECMQQIHERLKKIEEWHDDRADAMHQADEAMEEASELEHGPYQGGTKKMTEYEVDWESLHSTIVKADNKAEAREIVKEMADIEASFIKIVDGPFVTKMGLEDEQ